MVWANRIISFVLGATLATVLGVGVYQSPRALCASNDRNEQYVICTGPAGVNPRSLLDGVWLLDHKQGKLLATFIDRSVGKSIGFAELDLVKEFGVHSMPQANFLMTTGTITAGQAALYLIETNSGKFGVYTMGPSGDTQGSLTILRHDLTSFRKSGS